MQETAATVTPPPGNTAPAKWRPPVLIGKDDTPPVVIPPHLLARAGAPRARIVADAAQHSDPATAVTEAADGGGESVSTVIRSLVSRCVDLVCGTDKDAATAKPAAAAPASAEADALVAADSGVSLMALEAALAGTAAPAAAPMDTDMVPLDIKPLAPAGEAADGAVAMLCAAANDDGGAVGVYETRHMADPELVRGAIAEAAEAWRQRALDVERVGGYRPAEVDDLLEAQHQFEWGDVDPDVLNEARNKLLSAKDWYADVQVGVCHGLACLHVTTTSCTLSACQIQAAVKTALMQLRLHLA